MKVKEGIYTMEDWKRDVVFQAEEGQLIEEEIYDEMLNCMMPHNLPKEVTKRAMNKYNIPVHAGFLMGEPHCTVNGEQMYLAFVKNDFGKGTRCYYLGLSPKRKELNGKYYRFESIDADANGIKKASEFESLEDAIQYASDKEASLYFREYKEGFLVKELLLYEPEFM